MDVSRQLTWHAGSNSSYSNILAPKQDAETFGFTRLQSELNLRDGRHPGPGLADTLLLPHYSAVVYIDRTRMPN